MKLCILQVNRELLKDDWLDEQLGGVAVRSDEDRINEVSVFALIRLLHL